MLHVALDIRTLSFITVLFAFGFGTGLITFGIAHSTYYGIKQVGMGLLLIGAGCLLIGLREDAPAALSIVAANTGIGGGFLLMNLGIRSFRKLPRAETLFGIPIVVLIAVSLAYYTYVQFSCNYRVFWFSLFTFILSAMCFRSILQGTERMLAPQKVIAAALVLFSAFAVLRSWLALNDTTMQEFMKAGTIHAMAFLAVILVMVAVSFGLVWLANEQLLQEHHQYERIIATTPNGIALVDREGRYQMVNDAILQFLGLTREEILGKKSSDLFGREMYESITLPNVQAAFAGETRETSTWLELPGGKKLYLSVTYHPVPDAKGKNSYTAIHIKDMTELHFAQKEKQRIFDLSLDLFCIGRMDGHFIEVNPAWSRTLGWSEKELLAMPWMDLAHPDDRQASIEASKSLFEGKPVIDFVNRIRNKQGTYKHISWMTYPDQDAQIFYSVGRDVSDRIRMEEELRELATKDPLTGANNRRAFMEHLNTEVVRSTRYDFPLSLLMLDIDHFKNVNDSYGHAVGDQVLKLCVINCQKTLRSSDVFGRIGGEEFAVMLPHTNLEYALETAERLRTNLNKCAMQMESHSLRFTVSVGVAELLPKESVEDLLKRADGALYRAKENGRNTVEGC